MTATQGVLLVGEGGDDGWIEQLAAALPEFDVWAAGDTDLDPATVTHLAMWRPPAELQQGLDALEAICLLGAGYDHLDLDALPDVPIVRLIDPAMADDIALYVLHWVIHFQRDFDRFATLATSGTWRGELSPVFTRDVTVGVFGAGEIGRAVLEVCAGHGFDTVGWSRSDHDRSKTQFFADCDVVVDLVPLSPATRGVIGADELTALHDGVLINVGRGATVDDAALHVALDGSLRAAVLDVFDTEPLPASSPLWRHPKVVVTPHVAGRSDPVTAAPVIAASIEALRAGSSPVGTIERGAEHS